MLAEAVYSMYLVLRARGCALIASNCGCAMQCVHSSAFVCTIVDCINTMQMGHKRSCSRSCRDGH
jgi:hypothetical protein